MGGKALKIHGVETERKETIDFLRICKEVEPILNEFGITTHLGYHNRTDFSRIC